MTLEEEIAKQRRDNERFAEEGNYFGLKQGQRHLDRLIKRKRRYHDGK